MQQTTTGISNGTGTINNPWKAQNDAPDAEYKIKLVEERDRLLDQKSEL